MGDSLSWEDCVKRGHCTKAPSLSSEKRQAVCLWSAGVAGTPHGETRTSSGGSGPFLLRLWAARSAGTLRCLQVTEKILACTLRLFREKAVVQSVAEMCLTCSAVFVLFS